MKSFTGAVLGIIVGLWIGGIILDRWKSPIEEITIDGSVPSANKPSAGIQGPPLLPKITSTKKVMALITAYDSCDKECVGDYATVWPRLTAGGSNPETSGIAVDPDVIPYGSTVFIPGIGRFTADDTGPAMREDSRRTTGAFNHLDIRVPARCYTMKDPEIARKAHLTAKHFFKGKGLIWTDIIVIPPNATQFSEEDVIEASPEVMVESKPLDDQQ